MEFQSLNPSSSQEFTLRRLLEQIARKKGEVQTLAGRVQTIRCLRGPNEDGGSADLHVEVDDVLDV